MKTAAANKRNDASSPNDAGDPPHEEVAEALPVAQENIRSYAYGQEEEWERERRLQQTV